LVDKVAVAWESRIGGLVTDLGLTVNPSSTGGSSTVVDDSMPEVCSSSFSLPALLGIRTKNNLSPSSEPTAPEVDALATDDLEVSRDPGGTLIT
jgi:hypothetical protein